MRNIIDEFKEHCWLFDNLTWGASDKVKMNFRPTNYPLVAKRRFREGLERIVKSDYFDEDIKSRAKGYLINIMSKSVHNELLSSLKMVTEKSKLGKFLIKFSK